MNTVIVESPAKAKTIAKYLGGDYNVLASYGHVRNLVSKPGSVNPEKNFEMSWEYTANSKRQLKKIEDSVKKSSQVILATDPDREGEAISWHIQNYLLEKKLASKDNIHRIYFNAITPNAIKAAIENTTKINQDMVDAYLCRIGLDYLVGYNLSPTLWRKLPGSRSAGRVQSVALKLICEREKEIDTFVPEEYWSISSSISIASQDVLAMLNAFQNKPIEKHTIKTESQAKEIVKDLSSDNQYYIKAIKKSETTRKPYGPFTTSTMQQEAYNKLGFRAKKTMQVAQNLYEGIKLSNGITGLITYMRTDSTYIEGGAIANIRHYIENKHGAKFLPSKPRVYSKQSKHSQEAHEAIRPTDTNITPDQVKSYLNKDQLALYDLIWRRTIASQMESANFDTCKVDIFNDKYKANFVSNFSNITFLGFLAVYKKYYSQSSAYIEMPDHIKEGSKIDLSEITPKQHFTQHKPRYNEGSLIKELEEHGIGRPSTYASIISVLQDRQYVVSESNKFIPEPRGRILNEFLIKYFSKYVEYDFTASMEDQLDSIAQNKLNWIKCIENFWVDFNLKIAEINDISITEIIANINSQLVDYLVKDNKSCPTCKDGRLEIKFSKFGGFIGCSNYPNCNYSQSFDSQEGEQSGSNQITSIGIFKENGEEIFVKKGPYGLYLETIKDKKAKRSAVPKNIPQDSITEETANKLLSMPLTICQDDEGEDIKIGIGPYGPYLKSGKLFASYKGDIFNIKQKEAQDLIKQAKIKKLGIKLNDEMQIKFGRYGAYILYKNNNYSVGRKVDPFSVTVEDAKKIIAKSK